MNERREFFNLAASKWDSLATEKTIARLDRIIKQLDIKPGSVILDIGTGTGILLPRLHNVLGNEGGIVGLDISEKMLQRARFKNQEDNLNYLQATAEQIPLLKETFDLAICYASFPHFANKARALSEIARVLKQGGRLIICHTEDRQTINQLHQSIGGAVKHDMIPDAAKMRLLLSSAGMVNINIQDSANSYLATAYKQYVT